MNKKKKKIQFGRPIELDWTGLDPKVQVKEEDPIRNIRVTAR